jgi:hypothetical protein
VYLPRLGNDYTVVRIFSVFSLIHSPFADHFPPPTEEIYQFRLLAAL